RALTPMPAAGVHVRPLPAYRQRRPSSAAWRRTASLSAASTNGTSSSQASDRLDPTVPRVEPHLPDVDREDPTGAGAHDLGVLLPGVTHEDEPQVGVQLEDLRDSYRGC